jgi:MtN3 and saliva related transmembrane protein
MWIDLSPGTAELLGYLAATLTTAAWVPQVRRAWRTRSVDDLSLGMLASFTLGVFLWLVYGLAQHSRPIVAANAVTLVLSGVLIALRLRFGGATGGAGR